MTAPTTVAAHTPGPWVVHVDEAAGIGRTKAVFVFGWDGGPDDQVARVNSRDGLDEQRANARLIAASPALLEALAAVVKAYDAGRPGGGPGFFTVETHQAFDAARAAISAARGE